MRLEQEKETYDQLTKALRAMYDSVQRWDVQMTNYSYTPSGEGEKWLRIATFRLNAKEINRAIAQNPEIKALKSLKKVIVDLKQEWFGTEWPVLTEHQMEWARKVTNTLDYWWPSWDKVETMIREEMKNA